MFHFFISQEKNRRDALEARDEARWALEKLQSAQQEKQKLSLGKEVQQIWKLYEAGKAGQASAAIEKILSRDNSLAEAWELKGLIHFENFEFMAASMAWRNGSYRYDELRRICLQHRGLKPRQSGELFKFITKVYKAGYHKPFRRLLKSGPLKALSLREKITLAKNILYMVNDQVFHRSGKFTIAGKRVDVDLSMPGQGLLTHLDGLQLLPLRKLLIPGTAVKDLSPLRGLPLEVLILTRTPVMDLSPLAQSPLKVLDLEACGASNLQPLAGRPLVDVKLGFRRADLTPLGKCRSLKRVELPKDLYSAVDLKRLPQGAKVVYRDFSVRK